MSSFSNILSEFSNQPNGEQTVGSQVEIDGVKYNVKIVLSSVDEKSKDAQNSLDRSNHVKLPENSNLTTNDEGLTDIGITDNTTNDFLRWDFVWDSYVTFYKTYIKHDPKLIPLVMITVIAGSFLVISFVDLITPILLLCTFVFIVIMVCVWGIFSSLNYFADDYLCKDPVNKEASNENAAAEVGQDPETVVESEYEDVAEVSETLTEETEKFETNVSEEKEVVEVNQESVPQKEVEDLNERDQIDSPDFVKQMSAVTSQISNLTKSLSTDLPVASTNPVDDENSNKEIDALKIVGEIELVMQQANVTWQEAVKTYIKNHNDVLDTILDLTMWN